MNGIKQIINKDHPKATELYEQLDKNIGRQRNKAWYGWKIIYGEYDSEDDDTSDSN